MENYNLNRVEKGLEIINKSNNEKICECFLDMRNKENLKPYENLDKKLIFFKNNGVDHILYNTYEEDDNGEHDYIFPEVEIINLETKEKIWFQPMAKMGFIDVQICEQKHIIIIYGYISGMIMDYSFFDFDGNELDADDIVDNKYNEINIFNRCRYQFKMNNNKLYFELILPEQYIDSTKYPYGNVNFNLEEFTKDDNNLILKYENSYGMNKSGKCYILRCFNFTDNIDIVSLEEMKKITTFLAHCDSYNLLKHFVRNFENNNIFKTLVSGSNNMERFKRIDVIKRNNCDNLINFTNFGNKRIVLQRIVQW
jgi:hypothetical protein